MMNRIRLSALILAAVFTAAMTRADEFDSLRLKWSDMLTFGTNASPSDPLYSPWIATISANAQSYLNTMSNSPGRTCLWKTYSSLSNNSSDITGTFSRLRTMALAYRVRGSSLEGNPNLLSNIVSGLDWMNANYYTATGAVYDNWFDFNIAAPLALNDTIVLLYSNFSPAQIMAYMGAVEHYTPAPDLTAANKVWKAMVVGLRGVIVKDGSKIELSRQALSDIFPSVTSGDGFYADGSFIFHNYFPYNGGYGVEMLDTVGSLMQLLQNSTWQVNDPAQTNLFRWVYDGYEPFLHRGALMPMVDGRYHTRTGNDHAAGHDLLGAILRIAQFAPARDATAYRAFVKGMIQSDSYRSFIGNELPPYNVWANDVLNDTNITPAPETQQHRQFPGMDRIVHRTPCWTFGVSMCSSRVANYESTRGENLRGWFTAEGMTYLHNDDLGQYTDNFWSTVDPYRMPGTTIDTATRTNGTGDSIRSPNAQIGGAALFGLYGVAAMHLNAWNSTLSARKSWFMFDNEIVCLGNSISCTNGSAAETIVENRRLNLYGNNAFTFNGTVEPIGPGWSETMTGASWAHLAGSVPGADVGYYFPTPSTVKVLRESRSGSFSDINTTYGSTSRSTRHYLTMWFDHGTNSSGASYSYVLLPNRSASEVAAYAAAPEIAVITNTSAVSAVRKNKLGITAINFWRDQSNFTAGVSSDRRASLIFRNTGALLDIGVSDPTQTNTGIINIEIASAASATISADPAITVLQTSPTIRMALNVSNKLGATLRAQFAIVPVQTNIYSPIADAYVQNGAQSPTNFGLTTTLQVKTNATAGQTREAYLQFDLSSLTGNLLGANLKLVPVTTNDALNHAVALVPENSWTETGIVWNNKPPSLGEYARWIVPTELTPVIIPVTGLAQQALDADGKLSLRVYSTGTPTPINGGFTAYGSQQTGVAANRPQLLVTSLRLPPTVMLSTTSEHILNSPATVTLKADAQDGDGVLAGVDFYYGTNRFAQVVVPPYTASLSGLAPGSYSFTAIATDNSGLSATSAPIVVAVYAPQPEGRGTGLNGDYFSDRNLTTLGLSRIDPNINFTWGSLASPAPQIPPDFSARWTGKLQARYAGLHYFHTVSDEGVRLWIDGKLLIDNWNNHLQTEDTGGISLVPGRYYDIVMEFYDATASAVAQLYWTQPGMLKELVPQSQLYPSDTGLRALYFNGTNLTTPVLTRVDAEVNFNWGTTSPEPTLLPGPFSARWIGKIRAPQTGNYSFFTLSDDAVRLSINGQFIISNWTAHTLMEDSNSIPLVGGDYYDVTLDYFNLGGPASVVLMWQPPGDVKQIIPRSYLTPHRYNSPPSLSPVPTIVGARTSLVTFAASAVDNDVPGQSLTFSLDAGAPTGASIDPNSGVFTWTPANSQALGPQKFTVRVSDGGSPEMTDAQSITVVLLTNMASANVTLIPTGGLWRYQDNGVDQATAWRNLGFNDAGWKAGAGTFGYGIGDERTVLSYGANASNKFPTSYFRTSFFVPDVSFIQGLNARLARDDGAVVYLNGTEIWRENMPSGAIGFTTLASSEFAGSQTQLVSRSISTSALVTGSNVLAVEIHQASTNTPDARFDFELKANGLVPTDAPLFTSSSANSVLLTWPAAAGLLRPYTTTNLSPPVQWQRITNPLVYSTGNWSVAYPISTNANLFFRLQTP